MEPLIYITLWCRVGLEKCPFINCSKLLPTTNQNLMFLSDPIMAYEPDVIITNWSVIPHRTPFNTHHLQAKRSNGCFQGQKDQLIISDSYNGSCHIINSLEWNPFKWITHGIENMLLSPWCIMCHQRKQCCKPAKYDSAVAVELWNREESSKSWPREFILMHVPQFNNVPLLMTIQFSRVNWRVIIQHNTRSLPRHYPLMDQVCPCYNVSFSMRSISTHLNVINHARSDKL